MRRAALALAALLAGCPSGADDAGDDDAGRDDDDAGADDDDAGADDDDATPPVCASVGGTVTVPDRSIAPERLRIDLCSDVCLTEPVAADGSYRFDCVRPAAWSFHAVSGHANQADGLVPLTLVEDEERAVDPVMLSSPFRIPIPETAQRVALGGGLSLTVGRDQFRFGPEDGGAELFAVSVPEGARLPVELDGFVMGLWYLEPFDVRLEPAATLSVPNGWGALPEDGVTAWVASYVDAAWLPLPDLQVGPETITASLPLVSTVVLTSPVEYGAPGE